MLEVFGGVIGADNNVCVPSCGESEPLVSVRLLVRHLIFQPADGAGTMTGGPACGRFLPEAAAQLMHGSGQAHQRAWCIWQGWSQSLSRWPGARASRSNSTACHTSSQVA